ncbi:MAG: glycosyltransferase family 39 protein, partial [Chloroflexi bacterium]|nr:glycosyltransferase family 39 protein [Chloroflexota bacterium]
AIAAIGLTLLVSGAIAIDLSPYLRGPGEWPPEWRWWYEPLNLIPWRLVVPLGVLSLLYLWNRRARRMSGLSGRMLVALVALGLALQLGVQFTGKGGVQLIGRTLNVSYIGYFFPATRVRDLREFFSIYVQQQPGNFMEYSPPADPDGDNHFGRVSNHPPGFLVYYWLVQQAVERAPFIAEIGNLLLAPRLSSLPGWAAPYTPVEILAGFAAGLGVTLMGSLAAIPLYKLGAAAYGHEVGRRAAVLYLLTPGLTLFTPVADQMLTLLSALVLWLAYTGLARHSDARLALAGLSLSIGLFMSLGFLPIGITVGLLVTAAAVTQFKTDMTGAVFSLARQSALLAAPIVALWLSLWAWSGLNILAVYSNISVIYKVIQNARNYYAWLFYGPYDVLLFSGVAISLYFFREGAQAFSIVTRSSRRLNFQLPLTPAMNAAFVLAMAAVFVSGSLRGEVARTLLYCLPPIALFAAGAVSREDKSEAVFLSVAGAIVMQLLVFHAVLLVYR